MNNKTTTIEVYTIRLRKKRKSDYLSFSNNPDIYSLIKNNFINYIHTNKTGDIPQEKRTIKISKQIEDQSFYGFDDNHRFIHGIIETGLYGKELEIADKDDPEHIIFNSDTNAAVMKPFFFLIKIPRNGDIAYIILERTDNEGVSSLMRTLLLSFLRDKLDDYSDLIIEKENLITNKYIDALANGTIKSTTFHLRKLPEELADRYMCDSSEDVSMKLVVSFKGGGLRPGHRIAKAIKEQNTIFSSQDLTDISNHSEKSIITTVGNGPNAKNRTMYLNNNNKIRPYYLIDVDVNDRGYSKYSSIKEAVFKFISENPEFKKLD